jgi:hypothetical protein
MTRIDKACYERGCACHDDRVDGETVEVVQRREWVGLTPEEAKEISLANRPYVVDMIRALEARLKEKNT